MKASDSVVRMLQQEQKAVEAGRKMHAALLAQGFRDNGLGEMVIDADFSEIESRVVALLPAHSLPYGNTPLKGAK